ncbi:MAG TPA: MXAN_6640 family putative metalloprotease, partial [Actinomycetota bacterium]|nr:MXAN_6640 family putative metalloprotease [Actinomycetota bacterium]
VQFAYDWMEDPWLMEATATWIEDDVFDGINDNLQFLPASPLSFGAPWHAIDHFHPHGSNQYGAWIFFRFLSEYFGSPTHPSSASDRTVVRDIWAAADGRGKANGGRYAIRAIEHVLTSRGTNFRDVFADFGAANAIARQWYSEGASYTTPKAPEVTPSTTGVGGDLPMYHLSNDYVTLLPSSVTGEGATLTITLNLPDRVRGPEAYAVFFQKDGSIVPLRFALNDAGDGALTGIPFAASQVNKAILVLTNASTRYRCWQRTTLSCRGTALDDVDFHFGAQIG